jgi:protein involved in polysaccharide export with SLBB domain
MQEALRQAEALLGRPIDAEEALRLLQQSGMSADQVRDRLAREGFSSEAADPYLAVLEGRSNQVPDGTNPLPLVQVLTGMDLSEALAADSVTLGLKEPPSRFETPADSVMPPPDEGPPIFGREVFRRATSQFQAVTAGPVPDDYEVGPGDELLLVLTGDVELAYSLTVSREGWIVVPDLGRVGVNGRTLRELETQLSARLGQVYSGLTGEADATTFMDLSLGNLRANQIFVIGEVERPGAYELSSLTTALGALYWAGGPNMIGSFREVRVNRGGETVATVDLYQYLIEGRFGREFRLENRDVVFVPVARKRVEVTGAVHRPGIYEMLPGDQIRDLMRYAGGLSSDAYMGRVQIERVLPLDEQAPGIQKALLDVPLGDPEDPTAGAVPLVDGDYVTVFAVLDDTRNTVRVTGGVWRPGSYGAESGLRLWDLIDRAGGLLPDVFAGRAQIQRLEDDFTRRMIAVSLETDAAGNPVENPLIEPEDQVYVFAQRFLREDRVVSVGGWVRQPGVYPFIQGMTVSDLVLRAGGVRTGAYLGAVDVARVVISQSRGDTISRNFAVALDSALVFEDIEGLMGAASGSSTDFVLHNLDAVYVRRAPGFEPARRVVVTGEVMFPGPYSIQTRGERLTDLLARAGGLTSEAYTEGLQLWRSEPDEAEQDTLTAADIAGRAFGDTTMIGGRQGIPRDGQMIMPTDTALQGLETPAQMAARARAQQDSRFFGLDPVRDSTRIRQIQELEQARRGPMRTRVGVDFPQALLDPESSQNVLVEPNDSIFVPSFIPTVDVAGAVGAPTKVLWQTGEGVEFYVNRAGGYAEDADKGRLRLQLANGELRARGSKFLFFGGGIADPDPGAVITVPYKKPKTGGISTAALLTVITGMVTATATIILAANN